MEKMYKLLCVLCAVSVCLNVTGQKLSGTYHIPSGKYKSLTCDSTGESGSPGIFAAIDADTLTGDITIIIDGDLVNESGSNYLNQWIEAGAGGYKIFIKPDSSTEKVISMSGSNDLITLNGASRVIIDGEYNNDGLKHLRFRNNTTYNSDITFTNGASNDTMRNCYFESNNTFQYSATILFSTSTGVTGNINNTISNCDIKNLDTINIPYIGIYSNGSSNPQDNNHNTISNCNILNFSFAGISLSNTGNGDSWTITGNSFYSNLFTPLNTTQNGIDFEAGASSNSNIISGNYIGGSAPNCGGTSWINTGSNTFEGIYLNAGLDTATNVQYNQIQNINLSDSNSTFYGIDAEGGTLVNITNNIIGHPTMQNSIRSGLGDMYGIFNATAIAGGVYNINNNTIANILSISGNSLVGIGNENIFINNPYESSKAIINIEGNNIYNLSGSTSGIFNIFCGIDVIDSSVYNISGNSIHDLSTASVNGWNWGWGLSGIVVNSSSPGQTISQNYIYNLINTDTSADGLNVYGIVYSGPNASYPYSIISKNKIYNLTVSTSATSGVFGVLIVSGNEGYGSFNGGSGDIVNNMISLGSGMNGYSQNIYGIYKSGNYDNNIFYNSVYIGGNPNNGGGNTICYFNSASTNDTLDNNIFYNACNNTVSSNGANNSIVYSGATSLITNYNDYMVTGTGGVLSDANDTLPFIEGQDANSVIAIPVFVSATDLHLTSASANAKVEGIGIDLSGNIPPYTTDIDGEPRTAHPDLGADEYYACETPTIYNVTGGGTYCAGGEGAKICLSGSQTGVNYKLEYNGKNTEAPVTGTGNSICFGNQSAAGTYTVTATSQSGVCTANMEDSARVTINPIPSAPIAEAGTEIKENEFTANWESIAGAKQYYLDVAYDNEFISFVSGFNNKPEGTALSDTIKGLSPNTSYYYRVRDYNNSCVSRNSDTIKVATNSEGVNSPQSSQNYCRIYSTENELVVNYYNSESDEAILRIFNLAGQQVVDDIIIRNGNYHFALNLVTECYLTKIINRSQVYNNKIFIERPNR